MNSFTVTPSYTSISVEVESSVTRENVIFKVYDNEQYTGVDFANFSLSSMPLNESTFSITDLTPNTTYYYFGNDSNMGNFIFGRGSTTTLQTTQVTAFISSGKNKEYDGNDTAYVVLQLSGVAQGDVVSVVYTSATYSNKNASDNKTITVNGLSLTGGDSSKYTLSSNSITDSGEIDKKNASITLMGGRFYDGTTTVSVIPNEYPAGIISQDDVQVISLVANLPSKNVATYSSQSNPVSSITENIQGSGAGNYNFSYLYSSIVIAPKPLILNISVNNKVNDGTTDASANLDISSGIVDSEDVSVQIDSVAFEDATDGDNKNVTVIFSLVGDDKDNYTTSPLSPYITTANITGAPESSPEPGSTGAPFGITGGNVSSDILSKVNASTFQFTDPQTGHTQESAVYFTNSVADLALGTLSESGPQVKVLQAPTNYKYIFSSYSEATKNELGLISKTATFVLKVINSSGVIQNSVNLELELYLDVSDSIVNLDINGTNIGVGTNTRKDGSKYVYTTTFTNGSGSVNATVSGSAPSAGSDPHITTIFGKKYDFHPSTRRNYTLYKSNEMKITSHFTGLKSGVYYDKVMIDLPNKEQVKVDFNKQSIKGKSSQVSVSKDMLKDLKYENMTSQKSVGKSFVPKSITKLSVAGKNPVDLYVDFDTRYVHFRFPQSLPVPSEMSGLIVEPATRLD
jgi:hypothetical protein